MDRYVEELRAGVRRHISVVESSGSYMTSENDSLVEFRVDIQDTCPGATELDSAITKRFRNKFTVTSVYSMETVVIWCLYSKGYQINETTISNISNKDISMAWEFLETLRVSSTQALRVWISNVMGDRSRNGFSVYANRSTDPGVFKLNPGPRFLPNATPRIRSDPVAYYSVRDVAILDVYELNQSKLESEGKELDFIVKLSE